MKQIELPFYREGMLKIEERVKIVGKSVGDGIGEGMFGGRFKIGDERIIDEKGIVDYNFDHHINNRPKNGTVYYIIDGAVFLDKDLRRV